jgi:sec-independent protein translocase protein TatA
MFEDLGVGKILLILLVIMVLFGAKRLPDVAKGIGKGIRDFKKALKEDDEVNPSDKDKKTDK